MALTRKDHRKFRNNFYKWYINQDHAGTEYGIQYNLLKTIKEKHGIYLFIYVKNKAIKEKKIG